MRVVYSLKDDQAHADDWRVVSSGELPVQTCAGVIIKRYMGSMNDWPAFTIRGESGEETNWSRYGHFAGDDRYYQVGRRVEIDYVLQRRRAKGVLRGTERRVVLEVRIEAPLETIRQRIVRQRTTGNAF